MTEMTDTGKFYGMSEKIRMDVEKKGRMTLRKAFEKIAALSAQYEPKEIILVDLDTGECVTGTSYVDILTESSKTWNILWEVEIKSIRNDHGHLSVIYDSGIEQENGDPDRR